jgi:tryptophanyl-tRNA synthetase
LTLRHADLFISRALLFCYNAAYMAKKRLFTGLQPSGQLHIGNYLGTLKQTVELLQESDGLVMVADYHALTTLKSPEELRRNIADVVRDFVGVGIDPKRSVIFQQSAVPQHTELAWIFDCLVTVPFLMQAHAYKDKVAKGLEANAGLFTYPMLMAADILLYDTDIVPVGSDQKQHVEYAREAAAKFNGAFGSIFKEPQEKILESVAIVPGTDGKKMSKSYGNTIPLFGTKDEIRKAVMSIVTDSKGDKPENVYAIHKLFASPNDLDKIYNNESLKGNYKQMKEYLMEDIEAVIAPMRERRNALSDADVKAILKDGAERAGEQAEKKMREVRKAVGVTL